MLTTRTENLADGVTLYLGDCRDVLPTLPPVDAVVTDPPYGIAATWKGGFSAKHGWGNAEKQAELRNSWDQEPPDSALLMGLIERAAARMYEDKRARKQG